MTFRLWRTSGLLITALYTDALSWIEGQAIPAVEELNLPDSAMGKLVHKAYVEQTSLGWNLLFRGFWSISWRTAQEYEFSYSNLKRGYRDNGKRWAGRAQVGMFELFGLAWGMRNADEHGADLDTQRLIRLATCERAIRRLYRASESLPLHERQLFRDPIEDVLSATLITQERWVAKTEAYLPVATKRVKDQKQKDQRSLKEFFGSNRTPRIS